MNQLPRSRADHARLEQALAQLQRGGADSALSLVEEILERRPDDIDALRLAARCQAHMGHVSQAIHLQERAIAAAPGQIALLTEGAEMARRAGLYDIATRLAETALTQGSDSTAALLTLGRTQIEVGSLQRACTLLEQAVASNPSDANALAWHAYALEQCNQLDDARTQAQRALDSTTNQPLARLVQAKLLQRGGEIQACLDVLDTLLAEKVLSGANIALAYQERAKALDRLERYDEAFAAYSEANQILRVSVQRDPARYVGPFSPDSVDAIQRETPPAPADFDPPGDPAPPIFLVGFPRSGTTLLDQMLASHPDLVTLEEKDPLRELHDQFLPPSGTPGLLATLTTNQRMDLRDSYRQRVQEWVSWPAKKKLVDKLPMNSALLPVIAHVFPDAPVIVALRDPRDVCLSCFMQSFGLNDATVNMLTLSDTCRYYAKVMGGLVRDSNRLGMRIHRIRYEDLIDDPKRQLRGLCRFLDIDWDEALMSYRNTAAKRAISTPSYAQVQKPLYRGAIGRWKHYRHLMADELKLLQPMVEAFGYADSDE